MDDKVESIERLAKLLDQGKINEAEFQRLKDEVLTGESVSTSHRPSDDLQHPLEALPSPNASPSWLSRIPLAAWIMGGLGFVAGAARSDVLTGLIGGSIWIALVTGLMALYRWLRRGLTAQQLRSNAGFAAVIGLVGGMIGYTAIWDPTNEGSGFVNHPASWGLGLAIAVAVFAYRSVKDGSWPKKAMQWLYSDKD